MQHERLFCRTQAIVRIHKPYYNLSNRMDISELKLLLLFREKCLRWIEIFWK